MGTFVFKFTDETFQKHSCLINLPRDSFFLKRLPENQKKEKVFIYTSHQSNIEGDLHNSGQQA